MSNSSDFPSDLNSDDSDSSREREFMENPERQNWLMIIKGTVTFR